MTIHFIFLVVYLLLLPVEKTLADTFKVVQSEFFWSSPNLTKVDPIEDRENKKNMVKKQSVPLGGMSYKDHFDLHGTPPPLNFLKVLKEGDSSIGQIKDGHIFFRKTGKRIPLSRSIVPSWASPVPPYVVTIPMVDRVLVVYPYYVYQDKENRYFTELYSGQGVLLSRLDSLPTHVSLSNPYLLISPERSGCCESLKWSIRFYNLREGSVSEYSCPEGFCGNILFTKLGPKGPFVIVQEIVGKMIEIGASIQTNLFIIGNEGKLSASGKTIYAVREPNLDQIRLEALAPFATSNLISIDPLPEEDSWLLHFGRIGKKGDLKLVSNWPNPAPSVVYLFSKDPSLHQEKGRIEIAEKSIGNLPMLLIAEPGQYTFSAVFDHVHIDKDAIEIKSDHVNIVMF